MGISINPSSAKRPDPDTLLQTIFTFIEADTWADSHRVVEAHPELLADEVDALLTHLITTVSEQNNPNAVRLFSEHRELLRRCRAVGTATAFAEKMETLNDDLAVPPQLSDDWNQTEEAEQHYLATGDSTALDVAISAWERILNHPTFPTAPERFQLAALNNTARMFWLRYKVWERIADLDRALHAWQEVVAHTKPDSLDRSMYLNNLVTGFYARYTRTGELSDLEEVIRLTKEVVACTPEDSPDLPDFLNDLGIYLHVRYQRRGQLADLEEAIRLTKEAAARTAEDSPDLPSQLNNFGHSFWERYKHTGELTDLEEAIGRTTEAVACTPEDSPDLVDRVNNLGIYLHVRYQRRGQLADLEEAIRLTKKAVARTAEDSPNLPSRLNNLGYCFWNRYKHIGELADLEEVIRLTKKAVACTPEDSPDLPSRLNSLGYCFWERYQYTSELADLEEAIRRTTEAAARTFQDSANHPLYLNNLAMALHDHYVHTGQLADLEEAIRLTKEAVARTPEESSELPDFLNNLGIYLHVRYERQGQMADLEEAICFAQSAVDSTPQHAPNQPMYLNSLGIKLSERYARTGQLADLEEAICLAQRAVDSTPQHAPYLPMYLNNLGIKLSERYARTGQLADLEEATRLIKEALDCIPQDSPHLPGLLSNLGYCFHDRYKRTGQQTFLSEAIRFYQSAVARTPSSSPDLPRRLNNLGASLGTRYARTGQQTFLSEAIRFHQSAVARTPSSSPGLPSHLNNLGIALRTRYARTGQLADLDEAIRVTKEAVESTPQDSSDLPALLNSLGICLRVRYDRTGQLADLDEALHLYQTAVASTSEDSPDLPMYLNNLGISLCEQYAHTNQLADLDEAIRLTKAAVASTPQDSLDWLARLNNLGSCLHARYARTGQLADLDEAIRVTKQAVARSPKDSSDLPARLNNLGNGYRDRYIHLGERQDRQQAIVAYESACQEGQEKKREDTLIAARSWGDWASDRQEWEEANRAYAYGLVAIEQLYREQLLRTDRDTWLRFAKGLHARAAYAQSRCNQLQEAVVTLEQGRTRALREALARDRANLERVKSIDPAAYDKYEQAATRLREVEAVERQQQLAIEAQQVPDLRELRTEVRLARADLDAAIDLIRQIEGYERFLAQPDFDEIAATVIKPLIYLTTTPAGSLALIVLPGQTSVLRKRFDYSALWLDDFQLTDLENILYDSSDKRGYLYGATGDDSKGDDSKALRQALDEAWDTLDASLMAPLASRLHELGIKQAVLIPTGTLSLLPLHALVSSLNLTYAPSARVLQSTQQFPLNLPKTLLGIGNPTANNQNPLPYARLEVEEAAHLAIAANTFYEKGATRQAVVDNLAGATYLHFSCHGAFDVEQPLNSALYLAGDDILTLRDLLDGGLDLSAARLAVLSACQTGITDFRKVPDEAIGFPAGFLQAGVPGVISTLWPVDDISTSLLLSRFYGYHLVEGFGPAAALWKAQQWLQNVTAGELKDYFAALRRKPDNERPMTYKQASAAWRRFARQKREQKPFAHPFYWAAFTFTGV